MKKPLKEILSGMSTSEKISYIWEYYKLFIIGFIILVSLIAYSVYEVSNKKEEVLNIVVMSSSINPEKLNELHSKLYKDLLTKEERDSSNITIQTISHDNMQSGVEMQKVAAQLSVGDIDFFVVDQDFFDQMNDENQATDIEKLTGDRSLPYDEDQLYYAKDNKTITGINVSAIKLFDGVIQDNNILCTPVNAKRTEYIKRFLQYMLDNEQ